jgi:hypothetical protein
MIHHDDRSRMSTATFCVETVRLCAHYFALLRMAGLRSVDLQEFFGQEPTIIQRWEEAILMPP